MKKRSELFFSAVQVPIDIIMIILAALSAFAIRNVPQIIALQPKLYNFSWLASGGGVCDNRQIHIAENPKMVS